jgi:hypothetical protein
VTRQHDERLWVADDFFLIALDDRTGRLGLHPSATGLGLAGALVAELAFCGNVTVRSGRLYIVTRQPPWDVLAHTTLDRLAGEQHELHVWLAFLAQSAVDEVAARLQRRGFITRRATHRWRHTDIVYAPTDANTVAWRPVRLARALARHDELDRPDQMLAGLVLATGLARRVLWNAGPDAFGYLEKVAAGLDPPLRELVAQVQALVGNAVLSHRR